MRQKALLTVVALVVLLLVGAPTASASPNLINNGSFESGDFTGWTTGGNFTNTSVTFGGFYAYSGAEDGTLVRSYGPGGQRWITEPDVCHNPGRPVHDQFLVRRSWGQS